MKSKFMNKKYAKLANFSNIVQMKRYKTAIFLIQKKFDIIENLKKDFFNEISVIKKCKNRIGIFWHK